VPIQSAAERAALYRRWLRWWKVIHRDIVLLAHNRDLYRQVGKMIDANPAIQVPSVFYDWMRRAYLADQTSAIRRLADHRKDVVSLRRLIAEIADHPEVISRRRFVGLYRGYRASEWAHTDFDSLAGPGAKVVDRKAVRRDLRSVIATNARIKTFVDKHIAHRAEHPTRRLPAYADLDRSIDLFERLGPRYGMVLTAEGGDMVPTIQSGWMRPFRVAWLPTAP
jgi:hypothetical protein